ncbi:hypothetical protein ACQJBY_050873 [Aegilops geniculata]
MASFVSPTSTSSIAGLLLFVIASFLQGLVAAAGVTFTFTNRCGGTVWPGVLANSGSAPLETTGFALGPGEARSLAAPAGWSGRFWARTGCAFDGTSGGRCATGDCGSGEAECHGSGATPPATLVEFTLGGDGGGKEDYYDVSLVDGYNVPVFVEPSAAGCPATGCLVDLNERCPPELRAAEGCRSACEAFDRPEYCCSGAFGGPDTCRPSAYSQAFKAACPRAYSYAYDDATSTFTCAASAAYSVTFCPRAGTASSLKSSNDPLPRPGDVVAGAQVAADTWLASLATGESDAAAGARTAAALRAALAAAAVALLVSSL